MHIIRPLYFIPWILALALVAYGSLAPEPAYAHVASGLGNWLAFGAYAVLAALPMKAFNKRDLAFTCAWNMTLVGVALEVAQRFIPGREASMAQMGVAFLGVCVGVWVGNELKFKEFQRNQRKARRH